MTISERIQCKLHVSANEINALYSAYPVDGFTGEEVAARIAREANLPADYAQYGTLDDALEDAGILTSEEAEWLRDGEATPYEAHLVLSHTAHARPVWQYGSDPDTLLPVAGGLHNPPARRVIGPFVVTPGEFAYQAAYDAAAEEGIDLGDPSTWNVEPATGPNGEPV